MNERGMFLEAIDIAIKKQKEEVERYEFMKMALMKALPEKVKYKDSMPHCPVCDTCFFDEERNQSEHCEYCYNCGQKLEY